MQEFSFGISSGELDAKMFPTCKREIIRIVLGKKQAFCNNRSHDILAHGNAMLGCNLNSYSLTMNKAWEVERDTIELQSQVFPDRLSFFQNKLYTVD